MIPLFLTFSYSTLNSISSILLRSVFLLHPHCYYRIVFSPGLLQHPSSGPPCFQAYPSPVHYLLCSQSYCPEIQVWFYYSPAFFVFLKSSKVPAHLSDFIFITLFIHKCPSVHPSSRLPAGIYWVPPVFGCWLGDLAYSGEQMACARRTFSSER